MYIKYKLIALYIEETYSVRPVASFWDPSVPLISMGSSLWQLSAGFSSAAATFSENPKNN